RTGKGTAARRRTDSTSRSREAGGGRETATRRSRARVAPEGSSPRRRAKATGRGRSPRRQAAEDFGSGSGSSSSVGGGWVEVCHSFLEVGRISRTGGERAWDSKCRPRARHTAVAAGAWNITHPGGGGLPAPIPRVVAG